MHMSDKLFMSSVHTVAGSDVMKLVKNLLTFKICQMWMRIEASVFLVIT